MDKSLLKELLKEEQSLIAQQREIAEKLRLLGDFKGKFFGDGEQQLPAPTAQPSEPVKREYRKRSGGPTLQEKVLAALEVLGQGTLPEVAAKYLELNPELSEEKAYLDTKHHLSRANREKKIHSEKLFRKKGFLFIHPNYQRPQVKTLLD